MEVVELRPDVHVVDRGARGSNNVAVKTAAGVVLIDTPWPHQVPEWLEFVQSLGGEVAYLIYTDYHGDHVSGSPWFGGRVVAHARTRQMLSKGPAGFVIRGMARFDPAGLAYMQENGWPIRMPEITFEQSMTLHVGGVVFELSHRPGHTPGTISVHLPEQRLLIAGDTIVRLGGPPGMFDFMLHDHFATLDAIEALCCDVLIPGHGPPTDPSGIAAYREELIQVIGPIEDAVASGTSLEAVLASFAYPDVHAGDDEHPGYAPEDVRWMNREGIRNVYKQIRERGPVCRTRVSGDARKPRGRSD